MVFLYGFSAGEKNAEPTRPGRLHLRFGANGLARRRWIRSGIGDLGDSEAKLQVVKILPG